MSGLVVGRRQLGVDISDLPSRIAWLVFSHAKLIMSYFKQNLHTISGHLTHQCSFTAIEQSTPVHVYWHTVVCVIT